MKKIRGLQALALYISYIQAFNLKHYDINAYIPQIISQIISANYLFTQSQLTNPTNQYLYAQINPIQIIEIRINKKMGQTCNTVQPPQQPQMAKINTNTFSTAAPVEESAINVNLSESRFLQSRASNIKRRNDNLSQSVKLRLSQLPDISRLKRASFDEDKKIYIDSLQAYYYGEISNNQPNGYGALQFDNGDYLEGQFLNGRCEGYGRYIKSNGSYYEGDLKNNVADGFGKFFDKTGYKYEGQWKNNMANGRGQAVYSDESKYNGEFINNKRHGNGVLMQNKCIFEGQFVSNKLQGNATMQNQNGQSYSGQWKNNQKHGKGVYKWPNGNRYEGQYKCGKREGFGIMFYANGQTYEGNWVNGFKEGDGIYKTHKNSVKGIWRKGDLLEEKK